MLVRFSPCGSLALADACEERLRIVCVEMGIRRLDCAEERFFALMQYQDFICNLEGFVAVRCENDGVAEERELL